MMAKELAVDASNVAIIMQSWTPSVQSSFMTHVQNDKHVGLWLRDNSWHQLLTLTRDEKHVIRHKAVVIKVSTNLALLHEHKNRITGQLARVLVHRLVSHWTGEIVLVLFTHDGSRRIWRAPNMHSDKFGVNVHSLSPRGPV
jgi:hypothetical protein